MSTRPTSPNRHVTGNGTLTGYIVGFGLSLLLTLEAYYLVTHHVLTSSRMVIAIGALALLQFIAQLIFFLHLGSETKPRWKLLVFWFMVTVVLIIVVGSIWIMNNLGYHSPTEIQQYLHRQDGL